MTADDVIAVATAVGVIVAALFGATGFVVGLVGLHHARKAKEAAATANLIAKDANKIASGANSLSTEANTIAREANEIAKASEVRATEQHDVTWECTWRAPGLYAVRNEGKDPAVDVRIQVTVDDEIEETSVDLVHGGETVLLDMPQSKAVWAAEKLEDEQRRRPHRVKGLFGEVTMPNLMGPPLRHHFNRDRILWRTSLGTPREHDKSYNLGSVGP